MRRHGYMAQYDTESPTYLNKIPKEIRDFAVLLEPMSVVQKGIDHAYLLQRRLKAWKPKLGMVLGAGPIGLLAAAVLRVRGLRTVVVGREDPTDFRAGIAKQMGAEYVSVANKRLPDVPKETGFPDIVIEATGVSRVVFDAMEILGPNGVLCLLSVTGGDTMNEEPIDSDQPAARARQPGRLRQRERQPTALQAGRQGLRGDPEEVARVDEQAADEPDSVAGPQEVVHRTRLRYQIHARNRLLEPRSVSESGNRRRLSDSSACSFVNPFVLKRHR